MPVENKEIVKPAVPRVSPAVCLKSFNMFSESFNIPSGKRLHMSYGKSPCFMGKSTINIYQSMGHVQQLCGWPKDISRGFTGASGAVFVAELELLLREIQLGLAMPK